MECISSCINYVLDYVSTKPDNGGWKPLKRRKFTWRYKDTNIIADISVHWINFYFNKTDTDFTATDWDYYWGGMSDPDILHRFLDNPIEFIVLSYNKQVEKELNKLE